MYRLTNSVPYLLNRAGVRMGELFSQRLAPYKVTLPMYRVLAALSERGNQRLGDLSAMTSVEMSTLSRLVGALDRRGLVSRTRPDSNARTVEINLTAKGRTLAATLMPLAAEFERVGTLGFTRLEIDGLKDRLTAIFKNIDQLERDVPDSHARVPKSNRGPASARHRLR